MKNSLKITLFTLSILCINSLNVNAQEIEIILQEVDDDTKDPIREVPKKILYKYATPLIPDEETAIEYADIVLKKRYKNIDFNQLKPYEIKLIADDWIWEIKVTQQVFYWKKSYFYLRINKNTGEIVNFWVER